jgi:hypothetical protein
MVQKASRIQTRVYPMTEAGMNRLQRFVEKGRAVLSLAPWLLVERRCCPFLKHKKEVRKEIEREEEID